MATQWTSREFFLYSSKTVPVQTNGDRTTCVSAIRSKGSTSARRPADSGPVHRGCPSMDSPNTTSTERGVGDLCTRFMSGVRQAVPHGVYDSRTVAVRLLEDEFQRDGQGIVRSRATDSADDEQDGSRCHAVHRARDDYRRSYSTDAVAMQEAFLSDVDATYAGAARIVRKERCYLRSNLYQYDTVERPAAKRCTLGAYAWAYGGISLRDVPVYREIDVANGAGLCDTEGDV